MKAPCPCGAFDLTDAPSCGIWTLANIAVEYRECPKCLSTRPYMHPPTIDGLSIQIFHDPRALEPIDGSSIEVTDLEFYWSNLLEAIAQGPIADVAELRRDGVVLARAYCGVDGVIGWKLLPPA